QLSSSSLVAGSSKEPARPPRVLRASISVTVAPADSRATEAAIPASPPPTTITFGAGKRVMAGMKRLPRPQRPPANPQLVQRRKLYALAQDSLGIGGDFVENGVI